LVFINNLHYYLIDIDYTKDPSKNKKVFGVPLETAVKNSKIKDDYELPAIVYRCIEYLDAKGGKIIHII